MPNLTRRKVMAAASTIALLTVAAVVIAKLLGALIVGAFLAGAGTGLTIAFLVLAGLWNRNSGGRP